MARLVLSLVLLAVVPSATRADFHTHRALALALERHDASARGIATVLRGTNPPDHLRDTLECMEARLALDELHQAGLLTERALGAATHRLATLATEARATHDLLALCLENPPPTLDVHRLHALRVALAYRLPELERAAMLAAEAATHDAEAATEAFVTEGDRLSTALAEDLGPRADPWPEVERLWRALDPPDPVAHEWPARSVAPAIVSFGLFALSGLTGLVGSLPFLASGRRIPSGIAGAWGLAFGMIGAMTSAAAWQERARWVRTLGLVLVGASAVAGLLSIALLEERRGRFFGGGLVLGAGVGALWSIGGFAHHRHHADADDAWRGFLSGLRVGADRHGAQLGWQRRF